MEINKIKKDNVLTVEIIGKLNTNTSSELKNFLNNELGGVQELILDFDNLEYISSAGLRILAIFQEKMNNEKGIMKLINVKSSVMKIFEISGFVEILTIE